MRLATACLDCRIHKRGCIRVAGQDECRHCLRKGITCSLRPAATTERSVAGSLPASHPQCEAGSHNADIFQSYGEPIIRTLIQNYLYWIHDRPHSLFHTKTLWDDFASRSLPQSLILCLCAMGSRVSSDERVRGMAADLTMCAKKTVKIEIEDVCISTVQSCILLANICAAELEPALEALYFGIANRMAHILRLNENAPTDSAILSEIKCRLWWTLVMADSWCSAGLGIPRQLHMQSERAKPPGDEIEFQALPVGYSLSQCMSSGLGMWAYMIQLVEIFGPINDLHHQVLKRNMSEDVIGEQVRVLSKRLQDWLAALPARFQLNVENIEIQRGRGMGGPFVALHLGFFHYSTLLYFRYLDERACTSPMYGEYAQRCRCFASSYSKLLRDSRAKEGCEVVYVTVGHMTVVSSSVLLHSLLFGDEQDLTNTRDDLTSNFAALIELRRYWPCLEQTMRRLLDFQDLCLQRADLDTYRVDDWMVRFLTEHSLPLDERVNMSVQGIECQHRQTPEREATSAMTRELMASQALAHLWHRNHDERLRLASGH